MNKLCFYIKNFFLSLKNNSHFLFSLLLSMFVREQTKYQIMRKLFLKNIIDISKPEKKKLDTPLFDLVKAHQYTIEILVKIYLENDLSKKICLL